MPYSLHGQKTGTVYFHQSGTVTDEGKTYSGKMTSYPIETGSNISDHVELDPNTGTIKGVLIGDGAAVATLENMFKKKDILIYTGSYRMENIVLLSLDFSTNSSIKNGFHFSAGFQKAELVSAQYVPSGEQPLMSQQDAGKSSAAKMSGRPGSGGLQTVSEESISGNAYLDYVNTFNNKTTPGSGQLARSLPTYTGFK